VEKPGDAETIVALVIHLRTGDEAMEAFTVATATVDIGCERATTGQVVAAGPVGEDTQHDAEWIFFDQPIKRSPTMVLRLGHPASGGDPTDLSFLNPSEILDLNPSPLLGPLSLLGDDVGRYPLRPMIQRWSSLSVERTRTSRSASSLDESKQLLGLTGSTG